MKESPDRWAIVCQTQQAKGSPKRKEQGDGDGEGEKSGKVMGKKREEKDVSKKKCGREKKRLACFRVTGSGNDEPL